MLKLVSVAALLAVASAAKWDYKDYGRWTEAAEICSTGKKQSPIDVKTKDAKVSDELMAGKLEFHSYTQGTTTSGKFFNNGHTVQFTLAAGTPKNQLPRITGPGLGDGYWLAQFHLHWGASNSKGSEHTVDDEASPAEIHFVHVNMKYDDIGAAIANADGLAVIGLLLSDTRKSGDVTTNYTQITKLLNQVDEPKDEIASVDLDLAAMIPEDVLAGNATYFRYAGSLTTPPCSEAVTWTLFQKEVPVLRSELAKFRKAEAYEYNKQGEPIEDAKMVDNFRPVQALNGREVHTNSEEGTKSAKKSSAQVLQPAALLLGLLLAAVSL